MFGLALVTQLPHVTQRVNANKALVRQLATAWSLRRLPAARLTVAHHELVCRQRADVLPCETCQGVLEC